MKYYSSFAAAKELGVTPKTLERWRFAGKFVPVMTTMGGHTRYSEQQIEAAKMGQYEPVQQPSTEGLLS
jgi:DNA-binding transcriptional MerR regulator